MNAQQSAELARLDATAQAELVRRGEVTPLELVDAAIERIERVDPHINAVVNKLYDRARAAAQGSIPDGPLRGVPYLVKDLLAAQAGIPQTHGSAFLHEHVPTRDSELIARLERAGLIIVGRTNTPEFGILPTTEPKMFGACHNPWDPARTPGGSSGGSAAAVAARLVPAAHGNDGGGSIRIPASCCGVFGLKPTRARNPLGPEHGDQLSGFVVEHALTRSVRDSATILDATAGPDVGDPYAAPPPARPFLAEVGRPPGRLRIGLTKTSLVGGTIHPDCTRAVEDAAALLSELGHSVEEVHVDIDGAALTDSFIRIYTAGHAAEIDGFAAKLGRTPRPGELEPLTETMLALGRQVSAIDFLLAIERLQLVSRTVCGYLIERDAWLMPTISEPPLPLGSFAATADDPMAGLLRAAEIAPFTALCNFTGLPGMSVPLYWNDAGLPIGVQVVGRFGDEATLFRLAAQLEQARPWAERIPPLSA